MRRALCGFLALWLAVPVPLLLASESLPESYPPFLIGPGDLLNITVYGEKDLPTAFLVESDGSIVFPLVGEITLGGLTQALAGERLATALAEYQKEPQVTVLVTESAQYNIAIIGNVSHPGKFRIRGLPNLLNAVAEAGGPLPGSSLNRTVLVRGDRSSILPLGDYLSEGDRMPPQPILYPGDLVFIPRSPWPTIGEWGIIVGLISSGILIANSLSNNK